MVARVQRRLMAALAGSALLHAWLMQGTPGVPVLRVEGVAPLSVAIRQEVTDWLAPAEETVPVAPPAVTTAHAVAPSPTPLPTPSPVAAPEQTAPLAPAAAQALPQPSDPTYYSAASLDVFPRAQGLLDLNARLAGAASGEVRATVLIDESGTVNEIVDVSAARGAPVNAGAESAARELLLATRFDPARKDGRIVKARVVVSLKYGG